MPEILHHRFIHKHVKGSVPLSILDLGAMTGDLYDFLHDMNPSINYTGIEIDEQDVNIGQGKGRNVLQGDLMKGIPCEDCSFDMVIMKEVLEHVPDTNLLLHEAHRVLKPRGKLLIFTPNVAELNSRIFLLFGKKPNCIDYEGKLGPSHVRVFTVDILKKLCNRAGFSVNEVRGTDFWFCFLDRNSKGVGSLLERIGYYLPTLSPDVFVSCEKRL